MNNTMVIGGQARLPKEISENVVLIVLAKMNSETGEILDVECSPCHGLMEGLFMEICKGRKIPEDLDTILKNIEARLVFKGKRALMTAVKDLVREYREFKQGIP